jgi:predicted O-methyltransferase YrrM
LPALPASVKMRGMNPDTSLLREVDQYIEGLCVPADEILAATLRDAQAAGLPEIHVSPNQGRLLYLLAKLANPRRILEIGTLGGYSTICLARALPANGQLISLELEEKHAAVARRNLERAQLTGQVEVRVGPALASLQALVQAGTPAFDVIFIDADKDGYPAYLDWSLKLVHPGSLILADNVIRRAVGGGTEPNGIREFNKKLAAHPALECILLPILRESVDGLAIARVK